MFSIWTDAHAYWCPLGSCWIEPQDKISNLVVLLARVTQINSVRMTITMLNPDNADMLAHQLGILMI